MLDRVPPFNAFGAWRKGGVRGADDGPSSAINRVWRGGKTQQPYNRIKKCTDDLSCSPNERVWRRLVKAVPALENHRSSF